MNYWLFKSERECFSWQDLQNATQQTTSWDGVRNYQARNFMRSMKLGDQGFFYHSGKNPEITGVVEIVREAYPDHTSWEEDSDHFDPRSTPDHPLWYMVDVRLVQSFQVPLSRTNLREEPELGHMELMKKGSRLSVQEVPAQAFTHIMTMAGITQL